MADPRFLEAYTAGGNRALQTVQAANEIERLNLARMQLLESMAPIEGLTPDIVEGVINKKPEAFAQIAGLKGGLNWLKAFSEATGMGDAARYPQVSGDVLRILSGAMGRGGGLTEEEGAAIGAAPGAVASTFLAGQATLGGREIAGRTAGYAADVASAGKFADIKMRGQELETDRLRNQQQFMLQYGERLEGIAKRTGENALAMLTDLQYPKPEAQAIAAKLEILARAQMSDQSQLFNSYNLALSYVDQFNLGPGLSKGAMKQILRAIDSTIQDYGGKPGEGPSFEPEPVEFPRPPAGVERVTPPPGPAEEVAGPENRALGASLRRVQESATQTAEEEIRRLLRGRVEMNAIDSKQYPLVITDEVKAIAQEVGIRLNDIQTWAAEEKDRFDRERTTRKAGPPVGLSRQAQ